MIQIISGTYAGVKRASDGPFSLPENEEARLVERGVAKYVTAEAPAKADSGLSDGPEVAPGLDVPPVIESELPELPDGVTAIPEYSVDNTPAELRAIGKMCGLTFKVGMSKVDMVAALDKHIEENTVDGVELEELEESDEDAPSFDAAEAVVE